MRYVIYAIENKQDGRSYVGRTQNYPVRLATHLRVCAKPKTALELAVARHGRHAFTSRVVAHASNMLEAQGLERLFTHLLESNDPKFGYNPTLAVPN